MIKKMTIRQTKGENTGFTVIEIVIALAIIAIFITLPIFAYSNYTKKSRDAERSNDIGQLQYALEQYKQNNGVYPESLTELVEEGYMATVPNDPMFDESNPSGSPYQYSYSSNADGTDYSADSTP